MFIRNNFNWELTYKSRTHNWNQQLLYKLHSVTALTMFEQIKQNLVEWNRIWKYETEYEKIKEVKAKDTAPLWMA